MAFALIHEAKKDGFLKEGQTIVEATSGNTGIGLAMVAAALGHQLVVCMPESFSVESYAYTFDHTISSSQYSPDNYELKLLDATDANGCIYAIGDTTQFWVNHRDLPYVVTLNGNIDTLSNEVYHFITMQIAQANNIIAPEC